MSTTKLREVGTGTSSIRRRSLPGTLIGLSVILGLLALGAVQGGAAMIADPHTPLGMTTDYLEGTPIDTYVLPGWFLLAIAAVSLLTLAGVLFDWRWSWASGIERAIGHRWPWLGSVLTGAVMLTFEIIELFVVPFHPVMHPLLIAMSLLVIVLPLTGSARSVLSVR